MGIVTPRSVPQLGGRVSKKKESLQMIIESTEHGHGERGIFIWTKPIGKLRRKERRYQKVFKRRE